MNSPSQQATILIVDDNPESIWPLIETLETDYEILCAANSEETLNIVFSGRPLDLILLDIMMPGMDGYELCERLKADELTRDIPVIFLTGKTAVPEEVKGLELGAHDYITKPLSLPVAQSRIKNVLRLKKEMERRMLLKQQLMDLNRHLERQVQQKQQELREARETLQRYEEKYTYLFQEQQESRQTKRILMVDDHPENLYILVEHLEAEYDVILATNGEKALEIAVSENKPELILLDVMMPGIDGYEVCSRLKARVETRDIAVIFVTALGEEVDETRGLSLGAVDFIIKPFSIPVVKARLNAALRLQEEMERRMILTQRLEELNRNLERRVQEKTEALRQAHDSLKISEQKYRAIYENALEGIFQSTPEGRFLSVSPSLATMLGYESPRKLLASITDLANQLYARPQDRAEFIRALAEKGEITGFETQLKKKNGESLWGMISAKVIRDDNSIYYQGFLIDISEQKHAEEELRKHRDHLEELVNARTAELQEVNLALRHSLETLQMTQNQLLEAEKMAALGTLVAGVAHEINTPVGIGVTAASYLEQKTREMKECYETGILTRSVLEQYLNIAAESTKMILQNLQRAADQIQSFKQVAVDQVSSEERRFNLKTYIDDSLISLHPKLKRTSHTITVHCPEDLEMFSYPGAFSQILSNLILNSLIHGFEGIDQGEIVLTITQEPEMLQLSYRDNGKGITQDVQRHIFEPFYTTRRGQGSSGLGLHIVYNLVTQKLGGTIYCESSPASGTSFVIRLPFA